MIRYTLGNILESDAEAIINTVNCEGYMGKGLAYQFKVKYPENNQEYIKLCKSKEFKIGTILPFKEQNRLIINFPTKNNWRANSEYSYIKLGLEALLRALPKFKVNSIAIPALGCGNGGLDWNVVKQIIIEKLHPVQNEYDFIIYEPNFSINSKIKKAPKLTFSHLVLMKLKMGLVKFNKKRLQKAAFMLNLFSASGIFKFQTQNFEPYNYSIDQLSKEIKAYQEYYSLTTDKAFTLAFNTLSSKSLNAKLEKLTPSIKSAVEFINDISTDKELELITAILYNVQNNNSESNRVFSSEFEIWYSENSHDVAKNDIYHKLDYLSSKGLLLNTLTGYKFNAIV